MALQVSAKQQEFAEHCGNGWDPDGHELFEGLQGGQLVRRRTDGADTADQVGHFVVAPPYDQRFKEARRLEQAHLDVMEAPFLEQELNPAMTFDAR